MESSDGFLESPSELTTIYCACVPSRQTPNPAPLPQTSLSFQPSPATTTPAKSRPGMRGREALKTPATFFTSLGFMAEACSSTSASPVLRSGTGNSWVERTDGGPYFSNRKAFMVFICVVPCIFPYGVKIEVRKTAGERQLNHSSES